MIKHIKGDIFQSDADVILHQVNCQGVMGSGVAKQVRENYPWVFGYYKHLCDDAKKLPNGTKSLLGVSQFIFIDEMRQIGNLFAQDRFGYDGKCYSDYEASKKCLTYVKLKFDGKKIAIPYLMACHRGGGDWNTVYKIIEETLAGCDVTLYEYNGG